MDDQHRPDRGRLVIAAACLLMASLIAGAQSGIIPSGEGAFFAPPQVITALWVGMLLAGALFLLPERSPSALKAGLAFLVLCLAAVVCNWSAFAPDVTYTSTTTISTPFLGFSTTREDPVGGRIVFGLMAIVVDLILVAGIVYGIRQLLRRLSG